MLKKIRVDQLSLGMHIKEFCGSWMEHPFWRSGFVLKEPADLDRIRASSIKEVWIDSSKGLDAPQGVEVVSEAHSEAQVEQELQQVAQTQRSTSPVKLAVEYKRAAQICVQSKKAVESMFREARMGNAVDASSAQKLVEEISDSVSRNASALISLARLKTADDYTYMHSVAVCAMMIALARQLGLDEVQTRSAGLAGLSREGVHADGCFEQARQADRCRVRHHEEPSCGGASHVGSRRECGPCCTGCVFTSP
jgi:hypothetical protein